MALSLDYIDAHIDSWQRQLASPSYPHRKHWPSRLFHHAPLENAVQILSQGMLRSRDDAENARTRDVAAPGVIDARNHAHDRVRLYFRPKTPTQYHIEGVRKPGDCTYPGAHAPVLIMLALDARSVLARPDIRFSNQNMQLAGTVPGDSEAYFSEIPFHKVFSEGGTGGNRSITDARCAEVLPASPLDLDECLEEIYLRSDPERDTLLYSLGAHAARWAPYCKVSDALKVFEKRFAFVQEIGLSAEGVTFRFNPRHDGRNLSIAIKVWNQAGQQIVEFFNGDMAALPPRPAKRWRYRAELADGLYRVEIEIDGQLAHASMISLGSVLF